MADYTKSIGSTGTMMIRDTGTYVEFWLKAGSGTFDYDLDWGYTINGVTDNTNEFRFESGGSYQRLGRWNVTTDQTVTFRVFDTGTSGLGDGGTLSATIDRTSAPPAPGPWVIEQIFDTSVQGDVDGFGTGGLTIDQVQVRYSLSSSATSPLYYDPGLDAYGTITGLSRKTKYYFWVRTHNSKGWSGWSAVSSATTHDYPPAPTAIVASEVTQSTVKASFSSNGDGGKPILEWEIGYSTNPAGPTGSQSGGSGTVVTGLTPGAVTYLWARGRNIYGWGAWSAMTTVTLVAGAWVTYGGVQKRAVPYVKVAGVWRVAEVRVNIKGLWKGTG